ncbi:MULTISPECIES: tRNA lysidine(34) synthetase TilS [unclassified Thermosipho (in: thermotogales)]|uniref:tRNA lysidine(34) synthetase TilS n=1 Tax=unclassified Thermosipho (in: thermotogales) TaxID=2676525 RepID=UPI000985B260|nr:tRNA lysidine(34) synthetase TilS [Thermosipho sp. 1223]MBT1248453.1 tRNA(Ile)-lysidine synthetase [Thermosipho sp. 1244]
MLSIESFIEKINDYSVITENDKILVAVSGGVDSMTLLYILNEVKEKIGIEIFCATINHGIRKESKNEVIFVKKFCERLNIPCFTSSVDALAYAKENKLTLEEAARKLRYGILRNFKKKLGVKKIAVAHNLNDLVENVLFRISRGTGPFGVYGMKPVSGDIIRPLLFYTRFEIESFAKENNIDFVVDKTNYDVKYTRNFIRHEIVPKFKKINPAFEGAVFRFVENLWELEKFVDKKINLESVPLLNGILFKIPDDDYVLIEFVRRQTLKHYGIAPDKEKLDRLKKNLSKTSFKVSFWGNYGVEISYGYGFLGDFLSRKFRYEINSPQEIYIEPFNIKIGKNDKDGIIFNKSSFVIRNWEFGDKIKGGKKLKEMFVRKKVPSFIRRIIPVFVDNEMVFFVPGVYVDKESVSKEGLSVNVKGGLLF